jgi:hypothetical protein
MIHWVLLIISMPYPSILPDGYYQASVHNDCKSESFYIKKQFDSTDLVGY